MTNRIIYSQATQTGKMVAEAVAAMLTTLATVRRVKLLLDAAQWGDDWAAVAAEVGGGLTPDQAHELWTIFDTAAARIDDPAVTALSKIDQG